MKHLQDQGQNILEFVVKQEDAAEARRVIQEKTGGRCLVDAQTRGQQVKLTAIIFCDNPEEAALLIDSIQDALVELHRYEAGAADKEIDF